MAFSPLLKYGFFVMVFFFISTSCCNAQLNPTPIITKALRCFNNRMLYESCQEAYRLNESGDINVPPEATDEYCNGPCLDETYNVLNCVDGLLKNFIFYNKATLQTVRATLKDACSDTSERGNFNVGSHILDEPDDAHKAVVPAYMFVFTVVTAGCLFLN
ncbi:uncharacterized protein LOC143881570 [Tasmannia lanceolata]|uniref:uncharacterized protein LOC143881570 n=1 Tax=Tasmannia lanceolata TaxID=3420 RepID=UPI004063BE07